jgi:hypothetical protein
MSTTSAERLKEEKSRLDEILRGPWVKNAELARKSLTFTSDLHQLLANDRISAQDLKAVLNSRDRRRARDLWHRFEPHWPDNQFTVAESDFRDSFDDALTILQLLELAVETGYLSLEIVRPIARSEIIALLWALPARNFLDSYDYWTVRYIADRVGIDLGLPKVMPPQPVSNGETQFGAFLALVSEWSVDADLDAWLGMLDGYVFEDPDDEEYYEAEAFYEFLTTGDLPDEANLEDVLRYFSLARGAFKFLFQLHGILGPMQESERYFFVIFFAYYLSKFFGYELEQRGYVATDDGWDEIGDASAFHRLLSGAVGADLSGPTAMTQDQIDTASKAYASTVRDAVSTLRTLWNETMIKLAKSHSKRL